MHTEKLQANGEFLRIYSSHKLKGKTQDQITKAVVAIHGTNRNADNYYEYAKGAVEIGGLQDSILVMAPRFATKGDDRSSGEMYFKSYGWKRGDKSASSSRISSFELVELLINNLHETFPNLNSIMILGHSAGGQFVQRFALGSMENVKYKYMYIPMNPSSFCYLSSQRFIEPTPGCDFNDYKYGLEDLNNYMSRRPLNEMITDYLRKEVYVFNGEKDDTDNGNMDTDCEAMCQGANRSERGRLFVKHVNTYNPENRHKYFIVIGVGHSGKKMIQAHQIITFLKW